LKIISFLTVSAAAFCLYLTAAVLRTKPRTRTHWLLAASTFVLTFWSFSAYFAYNAENLTHFSIFFYISISGLFLFLPLQNLFIRHITGKITLRYLLLIGLPALFFAVKNIDGTVTFSNFYRREGTWVFVPAGGTVWHVLWTVYFIAVLGIGIFFLAGWYRRSVLHREKKQIRLLIIFASVSMALTVGDYILHNQLPFMRTVSHAPILLIPWVAGYVIAVKRYHLFNITPERVTRRIVESIEQLVILVSPSGKAAYMNGNALRFFGVPFTKLEQVRIDDYFLEAEEEDTLIPAGGKACAAQDPPPQKQRVVHVSEDPASWSILEFETTEVFDRFGDPLGFLLIGNVVQDAGGLQEQYNVTAREMDVIGGMIKGWTAEAIACSLRVAERTVKTHISSIYRKFNVKSRVALVNRVLGEDT
jgi:DNA-binding CsgD family transcriptional regulator